MVTAARKQRRRDRWYKRKEQYRQERKYRYRQPERASNDAPDPGAPRVEHASSPLQRIVLCIVVLLSGCARTPADTARSGAPSASVPAPAQSYDTHRIVSVGGSITEIVFALGLGDQVVGVDSTSVYPERTTALPKVGYHRQLSAEGVLELRPSVVVMANSSGPRLVRRQIEAAGVPTLVVSDEPTLQAAKERMLVLGRSLGRAERAQGLVRALEGELARIQQLLRGAQHKPRVLFVYARGQGSLFVGGRENAPALLIELAGGALAVDAFKSFRPLTAEAAAAAAPEYILVPERGLDQVGGAAPLFAQPGLAATPAAAGRRVIAIEDVMLLGFGPRLADAVRELAQALHPELDLTPPAAALASGSPS